MITVRELAKIAGVSPATISKALNDQSDIGQSTKETILRLARENGYVKRAANNGRKSAFTGLRIGILFTDQFSKYYSKLLMQFNERIAEENGIVFTVDTLFSDTRAEEICYFFEKTRMVDGIICIAALENNLMLEKLRTPVVSCSVIRKMDAYNYDYVFINEKPGIDEAVREMVRQGHRTFAYLGEQHTGKRHELFREAMEANGIPESDRTEVISNFRYEKAGYTLMRDLLRSGRKLPTAIFCDYDDMAVGAGQAIMEAGFRVPEDFSIVSVDNSELVLGDHKMIASVDCNIADQVNIALTLLRKRIREPDCAVQNVSLLSRFICRETIGPAPAR